MSTVDLRADLHQLIDQLDDRFLRAVHSMVSVYQESEEDPILSYDLDGTPRKASELTAILDAEVEAARKGDYITIEDFKKESATWGQHTK